MAPDLSSLPASPRPRNAPPSPGLTSRRTSQAAAPILPTSPSPASLNVLPSHQAAITSSALTSPTMSSATSIGFGPGDNTGVGTGPGPLRQPRPLTAADLHSQMEKEQEAAVNMLTRELSILRAAHNASVASNTSSTSTGLLDSSDSANHLLSGPNHPYPSQRQHNRTASNTSTRSLSTSHPRALERVAGTSLSGVAPERTRGNLPRYDSLNQPIPQSPSRHNSTSSRRSGASSPAISGSFTNAEHFPSFYQQRPGLPHHQHSTSSITSTENVQLSGRYEETAIHKQELEGVKRENELLKRRIRELERTLSVQSRTRSESVASAMGKDEESDSGGVRVGESARGGGLR